MSFDVAKMAVEAAVKAGADYADARTGTDETESLTVRNQEMEGIDRTTSSGVGVRVLAGGAGGSPRRRDRTRKTSCGRRRSRWRSRRRRRAAPVRRSRSRRSSPWSPPGAGPWRSVPVTIPLEEKVALLMEGTRRMQAVPA